MLYLKASLSLLSENRPGNGPLLLSSNVNLIETHYELKGFYKLPSGLILCLLMPDSKQSEAKIDISQ